MGGVGAGPVGPSLPAVAPAPGVIRAQAFVDTWCGLSLGCWCAFGGCEEVEGW